jgi:conjugative relaxase-like TrwC/TraI family protein
MLTIRTITSDAKELIDYYELDEGFVDAQERYYTDSGIISEIDGMTTIRWHGKAAELAGMRGHSNREDFSVFSRGTKPGTNERIREAKPNPEDEERFGHDFCYSAPKSVSMALEIEQDYRVFDAHTEAVKYAMDAAEELLAQARIQVNGVRSVVNTGNLAMVMIPHHTSREGDPNLHTHVYVMNGTLCPDGKWRSLYHESLVHAQWLGSLYKQKLFENMQAIGYRTYQTKDGFELEGYSRKDIEVFSKRHEAIENKVTQLGLDLTPENKKKAVLTTRKAKRDSGKKLEVLQDDWIVEALQNNVGKPVIGEPILIQGSIDGAIYEVNSAIRHLSENSVSFSRSEIYAYALKHIQTEGISVQDLTKAIAQRKDLIPAQKGRLTTVDAVEREIDSIRLWAAGQGKAKPFMNLASAQAAMDLESAQAAKEGKSLKSGQINAVLKTLTSSDMHQIWHGRSGVGKSTALKALTKHLEGTDIVVRGYAPKVETAEELEKDLGIQTNTVQHLILAKPDMTPNQLWLVDEAGLIGAEDMLKMQLKAEAVGARIVLVGDTKQNSSIKAGSPMRSLMKNGATTYKIHEIIRQQDETQKEAVELISSGKGLAAFKLLVEKNYVSEIEDSGLRANSIVDQYIALSQKERDKTLILTGTNAERLRITDVLRGKLNQEGSLGESIKTVQLVSRQFTAEESRRVENYAVGDYVRFRRDYPGSELKSGKLYKIEKKIGSELLVSSPGGRKYRFDPEKQKDKDVYYAQNIQIAVGDKLRWTAKNKEKGLANGRRFTVAAIHETTMTILDAKTKKTQEVSLMEPLALDYNWVVTSYKGQGHTIKRSLTSITKDQMASQEPVGVNISRQVEELQIFVEDLKDLKDRVQHSNTQKNPLDLIGETYAQIRHETAHPSPDNTRGQGIGGIDPSRQGSDANDKSTTFTNERDGSNIEELTHINVSTPVSEGVEQSIELIGENHGINRHAEPITGDRPVESKLPDISDAAADYHSAEPDHHSAKPGTANERQGALEYHPTGDETDPQQLYVATDRDYGGSEVGQDARGDQTTHQDDGQLDRAIGGQQYGATTGQPTSDGRLRGNHGEQDRFTQQTSADSESGPEGTDKQWSEILNRFAKAVQSVNWDKSLVENGLNEKLSALDERIEVFSADHVQLEFRGLSQLAERLEGWQSMQTLSENLTQLQSSLSQLDEVLEQTAQRAQLDAVDRAIQQWRAEQSISETVLEQRFEDAFQASVSLEDMRPEMERLARAIGEWKSEQQLAQVVEQLSGRITQQPTKQSFEQLTYLAELIQSNQSQQALLDGAITDKCTELIHGLQKHLTQPQDSFERLDELASALRNVQTNTALIENSFEQKLESLSDRVNQFTQQSPEFAKLEELGAAILEHQSQQAFSEQFEKLSELNNLMERQQLLSDLSGLILQHNDEKTFIETGLERFETLSNRLIQLNSQTQEYRFNGFVELATAINERRAEQAISENLETFKRATVQFQEQLQAQPDLRYLADTIQSLRDNPENAEGATAEQLQQIAKTLREHGLSTTPKPKKPEVFWVPDYSTAERPDHIEPQHWEEMKQSVIHPDLIAARFQSVEGMGVYERLLSDKFMVMGAGQETTKPMQKKMAEFEQVAEGAWWYKAGKKVLDFPNLSPGETPTVSTGGSMKADNPRVDTIETKKKQAKNPEAPDEYIKYENPIGPKKNLFERDLFFADVSEAIAQRIYDKYNITPTPEERASGFWYVVYKHVEIPIYRVEGGKKDASITSQGRAVIGGSGVNAGYRANDLNDNKLERRLLHPQLEVFAQPGREFRFANDQDEKVSAILNVRRDSVREGELLEERGCITFNISWDGKNGRKGADDLIFKNGPLAFEKADRNAYPMQREANIHYRTQYNALASQVRKAQLDISREALDVEVYLRAIAKGEPKDGDRFLSQSDQARTLKDPALVAAYIQQVKAAVPAYVQQQREIATVRAQQTKDRAEYETLAERVQKELGDISAEHLDIEVYLRAGENGDRVLAQSDHARTLSKPDQVTQYVEKIKTSLPEYQQSLIYKAAYKKLALEIQKKQGTLIPYRLDFEIHFQAKQRTKINDFDRLLIHSEVTKEIAQDDPKKAQRYVKGILELATLYESLRESPNQEAVNRDIPKLVNKKLIDTEAIRRLREEEELRRQQQREDEWQI